MFKNTKKEKFSLRKYKDGRTDSKLIGAITILGIAMLAGGGTASANVSSDGKNETELVSKFEKVSSTAKTTFIDDQNPEKKVTVDAVADIRYNRPTKANQNIGNADGTDSVKFNSSATVNYLLEDDSSKLKDSKKVAGEEGTVATPFDKKGIAYDTDGKDYRESTVKKTGAAIDEDTGKEAVIQANNKEYKWIRSEVVNANKATYENTTFNDVEAPVSPEGMHNNLGEINYGKITGKVYLVEETSDGHYGKFVEASGVTSDEDAVVKWKNGQATAKDFTKENVTLKEGDTVLVMDRDTYAHGSGTRTVNTVEYRREKIPARPKYDYTEDFKRTEGIPGKPTYAFWMQPKTGEFPTIGDDYIFGTADDGKVNFKDENILYYNNITKNFPPGITGSNKYNFKNESLQEILEEMHAQIYGILEYFDRNVKNETDRKELQARREELAQNITNTINMIKQNQIKVLLESENGLMFSQGNLEVLKKLRDQIEGAQSVLSDLEITLGTTVENLPEYNRLKNVMLTKKGVLQYSSTYGFQSGFINSYHKDAEPEHYSDWEKVNPEVETREDSVYVNKGTVTISDDLSNINVVNENSTTDETGFTKRDITVKEETDYKVKEIITPIRAYKVMGEGETVINHYYRLVTKQSDDPVKPEKPSWTLPLDAPKNEAPEYEGGVSPIEPPVQEIPEFKGGVLSAEPPVLEVPEFKGGMSSINPPVLEVPEFKGGVSSEKPPVLEIPEYKGGVPSERPTILEVPEYRGSFVEPIPNPKEQLQNLPTVEKLEEKIVTLSVVNRKKSERLPNTGNTSSDVATLGFMSMLAALVMSVRKRRKEK